MKGLDNAQQGAWGHEAALPEAGPALGVGAVLPRKACCCVDARGQACMHWHRVRPRQQPAPRPAGAVVQKVGVGWVARLLHSSRMLHTVHVYLEPGPAIINFTIRYTSIESRVMQNGLRSSPYRVRFSSGLVSSSC